MRTTDIAIESSQKIPKKNLLYLRSLVNVREPKQISNEFIKLQDDYLQERFTEINITDAYDLQAISNKLYLWQGDITTLKCGAIVNAANSAMLGCFVP